MCFLSVIIFNFLVCFVVQEGSCVEKKCNHFQDTAVCWGDAIFSYPTLRRQQVEYLGLYLSFFNLLVCFVVQKRVVYRKKCMYLFPGCSHFLEGCHFFNIEKAAGISHGSLLVILQPLGPFCCAKEKKRCNYFWDTDISCISWHFVFCVEKAAGKILQSLLVIFSALLCIRKKRGNHSQDTAISWKDTSFFVLGHWEGCRQITWISIGHFATSWFALLLKRKKRCNHFQDTAISWRDTIFFCQLL